MNPTLMTFDVWLRENRGRVFRYWVYRRMFTPYEEHEQFADETCFDDDICAFGRITEAITLPDGDILLGFSGLDIKDRISYYKLSEIRLEYFEDDGEEYEGLGE